MSKVDKFFRVEENTRGNVLSGTGEHNTSFTGTVAQTARFVFTRRIQTTIGYKEAAYQVIKENYITRLNNKSVEELNINDLVKFLNEKGEELKSRNGASFWGSMKQSTSKTTSLTRIYQRAYAYYEAYVEFKNQ